MKTLILVLALVAVAACRRSGSGRSWRNRLDTCPNIRCAAPTCDYPRQTYARYMGRRCKACRVCPETTTTTTPTPTTTPSFCPHLDCPAVPLDCEHGPAESELLTTNTGVCRGCPTCPLPPFCPHVLCPAKAPNCAAGAGEPVHEILTSPLDEKPCRGCLQCPEQEGCSNGICGHCIGPGPNRDLGLPDRCDHIECFPRRCPGAQISQPTCTLTFDGEDRCRACDDCIAEDAIQWEECPSLSCKPLTCDEGYRQVQTTFDTRLFPDGRTCSGCPVCEPIPPILCNPFCIAIVLNCPPGKDFVRGAFRNVEGDLCSTCPSCLPQCPAIRCALPVCPLGRIRDTEFISEGRLCQGCPECVEECIPLALLDCLRPDCDNPITQNTTLSTGEVCIGCPVCPEPEPECPAVDCLPTFCDNPEPTTFKHNGKKCPGCPRCPQECIPLSLLDCAVPECDNAVANNVTLDSGEVCIGCPICPELECPVVDCLPAFCDNPRPTTFTFRGRECQGCFECPEECTPLALLDCFRPPCSNPRPGFTFLSDGTRCRGCPVCDDIVY